MTPYYTLGRSGLRVSRLALGTMTFGTDWGWGADEGTARRMFDLYLEAGGNVIDTADLYVGGTSERWTGEFIRAAGARDRVVLTTKYSFNADPTHPNGGGNGRKHLLTAVEGSLRRLGVDNIDLYLLHAWDQITPVEEVMRTLDDLVRAGKVRHIGLSNVPSWYASRAQTIAELRGWEPVSALQLEYSLVERSIEDELLPLGIHLGMGTMVWSPLAGGLLSGKYRPSEGGEQGEGRLQAMKGTSNPAFAKFSERNWEIVAALEHAAKELDRSMAQVAVNWVANRPGVATVILGATKPHQLEDNLKALEFTIPPPLLEALDAASAPPPRYPYTFFTPEMQAMLTGGLPVGSKAPGYAPPVLTDAPPAGTASE